MSGDEPADIWGSFSPDTWASLPAMKGEVAVERDVAEGLAVFYVESGATIALDRVLPTRAFRLQEDARIPVVVIQLEEVDGERTAGFRYIDGGNGVCLMTELELVNDGQAWP